MIKEDYVSFETAKLLKEKGFDENCTIVYNLNNRHSLMSDFYGVGTFVYNSYLNKERPELITAPTIQMAMKWLRVFYQLHITVYSCSQESWAYRITKLHQRLEDGVYAEDFASYEEACDAAIKFCLENYLI